MPEQRDIPALEKAIHDAAQSGDDPSLAEALLSYFQQVRQQPYLTLPELKSLFISYNGRGLGRGESQRYPLSPDDIRAFERVRELTDISTNSIEGIIRTNVRASSELIKAQRERALSRQAADIISRLDKENEWLQGRVVQIYFKESLEIRALRDLVSRLTDRRLREEQEAILVDHFGSKEASQEAYAVASASIASGLTSIVNELREMQLIKVDDDELLAIMSAAKKAIPVLESTQEECLQEVQRRFADIR